MSSHPINLAVRFLLEIVAFYSLGFWGWGKGEGVARYFFAIGLPLLFMTAWGVFNVPNDPSRSGKAPIVVSGIVRLSLEFLIFFLATLAIWFSSYHIQSLVFAIVVLGHYIFSFDRIRWLLSQ